MRDPSGHPAVGQAAAAPAPEPEKPQKQAVAIVEAGRLGMEK